MKCPHCKLRIATSDIFDFIAGIETPQDITGTPAERLNLALAECARAAKHIERAERHQAVARAELRKELAAQGLPAGDETMSQRIFLFRKSLKVPK